MPKKKVRSETTQDKSRSIKKVWYAFCAWKNWRRNR